jgi:hypothetical protein
MSASSAAALDQVAVLAKPSAAATEKTDIHPTKKPQKLLSARFL